MALVRRVLVLAVVIVVVVTFFERVAAAQACCAGASGLTPGWLTTHERFLVGTQVRMSATHGRYDARGRFYAPTPGRDLKLETSLFGSVRFVPRGQVSALAPLALTRRRASGIIEERVAPGDVTVLGRYDFVRAGESRLIPGLTLLAGLLAPTGPAPEQGSGRLSANVTGIGAWEGNAGFSVEQIFAGHIVLHATVLAGMRLPREVAGAEQQLGVHALYLLAGGYTFNDESSMLVTVTHISEGDATIAGKEADGTGYRTTQLAALFILPLTDTLRLRTTAFTDLPPLGSNRPALGGSSIALSKSWL